MKPNQRQSKPPKSAQALLERSVNRNVVAKTILGDLREEYRELADARAPTRTTERLLAPLLFETEVADPKVLAAVAITLASTAILARVVPALRATRIDPNLALREQ